jgi:hypothetical protein
MKKSILAGLIFGLLFVSMIGFASAADFVSSVNDAVKSLFDIARPVLEVLVGQVYTSGTDLSDIFLAKVILMVILLSITYSVVKLIPLFNNKRWIVWIISLGVAILGVRYLTADMVNTIVLSHTATAVAVTAILPFIIYFIFVETGLATPYPPFVRRVAWIFYAVVFLGLWFVRAPDIPKLAWIYPATALVAFIMAWMDGTIQGWLIISKLQKAGATYRRSGATGIQLKMSNITTIYNTAGTGGAAYIGGVATTASTGKSGTEAYLLDMDNLEKELEKLLK